MGKKLERLSTSKAANHLINWKYQPSNFCH